MTTRKLHTTELEFVVTVKSKRRWAPGYNPSGVRHKAQTTGDEETYCHTFSFVVTPDEYGRYKAEKVMVAMSKYTGVMISFLKRVGIIPVARKDIKKDLYHRDAGQKSRRDLEIQVATLTRELDKYRNPVHDYQTLEGRDDE